MPLPAMMIIRDLILLIAMDSSTDSEQEGFPVAVMGIIPLDEPAVNKDLALR